MTINTRESLVLLNYEFNCHHASMLIRHVNEYNELRRLMSVLTRRDLERKLLEISKIECNSLIIS